MKKEKSNKSNENYQSYDIFNLVKNKDEKVCIAVGKYLVTEKRFNNFETAIEYINTKPYDILVNLICLTIHMHKDNENKEDIKSN